jgi:hypothetical protein
VAEAARWPVVAIMHTAAVAKHAAVVAKHAAVVRLAATQGLTIQAVRVPVQVMHQLRVAAADMPAVVVADMLAVVEDMVDMPAVADIGNP